jgi:PA-IL-like protein
MLDRHIARWVGIVIGSWPALAPADTLVLRDGRRVQGSLVAVRAGVIEFEARSNDVGSRERVRVNRDEVVRIELDEREQSRDGDRDDVPGSPARGRRSGLRERDVRVEARSAWTDTGIEVRQGQTLFIAASGRVRWGPNRQDGPQGERNSPRNDGRPIPSRPAGALIGRVGEGHDYFFVGESSGPIRMRSAGQLYIGINDDFLNDNSGTFSVTISY